MTRTFELFNFVHVAGDCEHTTSTFTVYTYSYGNERQAFTTLTWAELQAGYALTIDDDNIYQVEVELNDNRTQKTGIRFGVPSCCNGDEVPEDAFCFTFKAAHNNPIVDIFALIGETYEGTIYWGDETTDNISTDLITTGDYRLATHQYNPALGIKPGDLVTIAMTGSIPRLRLAHMYESDGNHRRTRLQVVSINSWGNVEMYHFEDMCKDVTSLKSLPAGPITAPSVLKDPDTCFSKMFYGCSGLQSMSQCNNLFSEFSGVTSFTSTFEGCFNMENLPFDIFSGCTSAWKFGRTFKGCTKLQISKYNPDELYYTDRIYHHGDTGYPSTATTEHNFQFNETYSGCSGWQSFPIPYWHFYFTAMPEPIIVKGCYHGLARSFDGYVKNDLSTPPINTCTLNDWRFGRYIGGGGTLEAQCDLDNSPHSNEFFLEYE